MWHFTACLSSSKAPLLKSDASIRRYLTVEDSRRKSPHHWQPKKWKLGVVLRLHRSWQGVPACPGHTPWASYLWLTPIMAGYLWVSLVRVIEQRESALLFPFKKKTPHHCSLIFTTNCFINSCHCFLGQNVALHYMDCLIRASYLYRQKKSDWTLVRPLCRFFF